MSTTSPMTAEQLLRLPDDGNRYELVAGELRMMSPGNWKHSEIAANIGLLLLNHVKKRRLGKVLSNDPGFVLERNPDTVLAPGVAYIARGNYPADLPEQGYWPCAPDLAVEVLSPNDRIKGTEEKIEQSIEAGCRLAWLVNPRMRTVKIYFSNAGTKTIAIGEELDGDELLPGFCCQVAEVFDIT